MLNRKHVRGRDLNVKTIGSQNNGLSLVLHAHVYPKMPTGEDCGHLWIDMKTKASTVQTYW